MMRSPGSTLAAVAPLSVGIAATAIVFCIVNALLLRSLPGVRDSMRLVEIHTQSSSSSGGSSDIEDYHSYRAMFTSVSGVAASAAVRVAVSTSGDPFIVPAETVSENYLELLGTIPAAGRLLDAGVEHQAVVFIGYDFALRHFGTPTAATGAPLLVNGRRLAIVGVAPPGFAGAHAATFGGQRGDGPQLWMPMSRQHKTEPRRPSSQDRIAVIARLAPDATILTARAEAQSVARHTNGSATDARPVITPLGMGPNDRDRDVVVAVGFAFAVPIAILALACASAANLQLARATYRQGEIAVRLSLGATRGRIIRQILVESLLLAAIAGAIGLIMTAFSLKLCAGLVSVPVPIDRLVLVFTMAASTLTAIGFGLAPALTAARGDLTAPLREAGAATSYRRSTMRSTLLIAQVALSLTLLIFAGLFARTLQHLYGLDAARGLDRVAAASLDLGPLGYSPAAGAAFQADLLSRVEQAPDVVAAGIAPFAPFGGSEFGFWKPGEQDIGRNLRYIHGGATQGRFLEAAGFQVIEGRPFSEVERRGSAQTAIVSQALARRLWPRASAVGQRLIVGEDIQTAVEVGIVGVTADVHERGTTRESDALIVPVPLRYQPMVTLWVRTAGDPNRVLPHIRTIVRQLDSRVPLTQIDTAAQIRQRRLGPFRWIASGFGALAGFALVLAGGGLYATVSFMIARRRKEMAIRVALGARTRELTTLMVRETVYLSSIGLVCGGLLAALAATLAKKMLVGISPLDPISFGAAGILLLAIAIAASVFPALRASQRDPLAMLRHQ